MTTDEPTPPGDPSPAAAECFLDPTGYGGRGPKDQVDDPVFARAVGLADEALRHFGTDAPDAAGVALNWTVLELEDHSELEPADPVVYDLTGRTLPAVLDELGEEVTALIAASSDLATTLRYVRARDYVDEARAAAEASGPAGAVQE